MDKQADIRFDDYIDNYKHKIQDSINFIGQDVDFFIDIKAHILLNLAAKYLGNTRDIDALDIGSGIGLIDKIIAPHFRSFRGVDVENGVIESAREYNPRVEYKLYDGKKLPFENDSFHLTFAINVIHHVPVDRWRNFVIEMQRILRPGGLAVIIEHNATNPLTRKVVGNCEFDRDAVLLNHKNIIDLFVSSALKIVDDRYIIFFPFKGRLFRWLEKSLKWLPLGAQQYVAGRKQ